MGPSEGLERADRATAGVKVSASSPLTPRPAAPGLPRLRPVAGEPVEHDPVRLDANDRAVADQQCAGIFATQEAVLRMNAFGAIQTEASARSNSGSRKRLLEVRL